MKNAISSKLSKIECNKRRYACIYTSDQILWEKPLLSPIWLEDKRLLGVGKRLSLSENRPVLSSTVMSFPDYDLVPCLCWGEFLGSGILLLSSSASCNSPFRAVCPYFPKWILVNPLVMWVMSFKVIPSFLFFLPSPFNEHISQFYLSPPLFQLCVGHIWWYTSCIGCLVRVGSMWH